MDSINTDTADRLTLEVAARNRVNHVCNQAAAKLRPYFESLRGEKIINADGSLGKKVRHGAEMELLFRSPDDGVQHWFEPTSSMLRFCCRTSYLCGEICHYVEDRVVVAWIKGQCADGVVAHGPLKEDYTVEHVRAGRERMRELQLEVRRVAQLIDPFDQVP